MAREANAEDRDKGTGEVERLNTEREAESEAGDSLRQTDWREDGGRLQGKAQVPTRPR